MNIIRYFFVFLSFLAAILTLSVFIYLVCTNALVVFGVWFSAFITNMLAELTSFYLDKIGLTNMKIGDFVLLAKDVEDGSTRCVGEVTKFINGYYVILVGKSYIKLNPKTLEVTGENETKYRFCGITQRS